MLLPIFSQLIGQRTGMESQWHSNAVTAKNVWLPLKVKQQPTLSIRGKEWVKVSSIWNCCRFVSTVCTPEKKLQNPQLCFCFSLPPQGFAFTGRDKPGFRPEFLPLTYLAKILSDIEEQGSVWTCVCVCVYPAFGGLRQSLCVHVRAWSELSSLMKEQERKCVAVCGVL